MFKQTTQRIAAKAATGLAIAALSLGGLGLFGAAAAHADPIVIGNGQGCPDGYGGTAPEFSSGHDQFGNKYICIEGKWQPVVETLTGGDGSGTSGPKRPVSVARLPAGSLKVAQ